MGTNGGGFPWGRWMLALAAGVGVVDPQSRQQLLAFMRHVSEALAREQEPHQPPLPVPAVAPPAPLQPPTPPPVVLSLPRPIDVDELLQPLLQLQLPPSVSPAAGSTTTKDEPDAQWRSVLQPPAVVLILGKRGGGKSALAYRLLELFRHRTAPYVVGVSEQGARALPEWIGTAESLDVFEERADLSG